MFRLLLSFLLRLAILAPAADAISIPGYGLKLSPRGRFFADSKGKPFFWQADTAWGLFHRLTLSDAERYFDDRAEKGFNMALSVGFTQFGYGDNTMSVGLKQGLNDIELIIQTDKEISRFTTRIRRSPTSHIGHISTQWWKWGGRKVFGLQWYPRGANTSMEAVQASPHHISRSSELNTLSQIIHQDPSI